MPAYLEMTPIGFAALGTLYDPAAPKAGCRICGVVFQSALDRKLQSALSGSVVDLGYVEELKAQADYLRREWCIRHSKKHSEKEHRLLAQSGEWCTPEAALKLAPYGIFPLQHEGEVASAMLEAPRAPTDDVEGT